VGPLPTGQKMGDLFILNGMGSRFEQKQSW
ncbi:uncharacterized protein PG998_013031, partial [Apiospora kogelbergensis]